MGLQVLVSAVSEEPRQLAEKMRLATKAIIVNQTDCFAYDEFERNGKLIRSYSMQEKGVGLSRNTCLMRADEEICLFSDEDIVYRDDYEKLILQEFEKNKEADMILFNVEVAPERRTYHIEEYGRVRWYNSGRYPTYSFAFRLNRIRSKNITFSLLFGGGAKYCNGEDSLFLRDCIKKGLKVYKAPVTIGEETLRESTWFKGYNEKFFYDRGVLYYSLYGRLRTPIALRFLLKHQDVMCREIPLKRAYRLMKAGMKAGRAGNLEEWKD